LELYMGAATVNENTDDIINGIADAYKSVYSLTLTPSSIVGTVGDSFLLSSNLEINGITTTKDMTYVSSASTIATVSGSGGIVLVGNGSTDILVYMTDNSSASATCEVVVSASSTAPYEIRVDPSNDTVLEGTTTTFSVYGYVGGVQQASAYVFSLANSNVPSDHYVLTTIDDNSFSVKNVEMYLAQQLIIVASSGSYTKNISIDLRGAW